MSRNAISANPEHYLFKIFRGGGGACPRTPLEGLKIFSRRCVAPKLFFRTPKQKTQDRTLVAQRDRGKNQTREPSVSAFKINGFTFKIWPK